MREFNLVKLWRSQSKRFKVISAIALSCLLFWSLKGIVFAEGLDCGTTITEEQETLVEEAGLETEADGLLETEVVVEAEATVEEALVEAVPEAGTEIIAEEGQVVEEEPVLEEEVKVEEEPAPEEEIPAEEDVSETAEL